jgi:hypothetical protein
MKRLLPAVVLLLLISPPHTTAQDAKSFLDKVREQVKLKFPSWQFVGEAMHGSVRGYTWYVEKQPLQCEIVYTESEQAAAREFANNQNGFPVAPSWKVIDIGDEAVFFLSTRGGKCFLTCRRYHVVFQMYAPTLAVAEGLAKEIAALVP